MAKKAPSRPVLDERASNIQSGWVSIAPDESFNDIPCAEFGQQRENVGQLRDNLQKLEQQVKGARAELASAELELWDTCALVVDGVIGTRKWGRNSSLYASFGLVPTSKRATGLTRKSDAGELDAVVDQILAQARAVPLPTASPPTQTEPPESSAPVFEADAVRVLAPLLMQARSSAARRKIVRQFRR